MRGTMYRKMLSIFLLFTHTLISYYAVMTAIPSELECVKKNCSHVEHIRLDQVDYYLVEMGGKQVVLCCSGYGTTNAAATASHLIQKFHPEGLIFCGVAGATDLSLKVGDVVFGEIAYEVEIQGLHEALKDTPFTQDSLHPFRHENLPSEFSANPELLSFAKSLIAKTELPFFLCSGILATTQTYPAPKNLYDFIMSKKTMAIDMESSAIYQTCWLFNTPSLVIRGISNKLNQEGDDFGNFAIEESMTNAISVLIKLLQVLP